MAKDAILCLDGSLGTFSCALLFEGNSHVRSAPGDRALEHGLDEIATLLAQGGCTGEDIARIGVTVGPGSFTGLRIAISYAKSLALAWQCELAGISSFDVLDYGIDATPRATFISPKRGIASMRTISRDAEVSRASAPTADLGVALAEQFDGQSLSLNGAPEDVLAALGERGISVHSVNSPTSPPLALLALTSAAQASALHAVRADYGELAPAKLPARR